LDNRLARIVFRAFAVLALSLMLAACQAQAAGAPPSPSGAAPTAQETPSEVPTVAPSPTFPAGRVVTRIVIAQLRIDLPIMLQTAKYGTFPLCDVALYLLELGQPGQGRATYIYAHARVGMFGPLLTASEVNNGQGMIGDEVEVYTSDDYLFKYKIVEVDRHTLDLDDAFAANSEELFLQTSEGPHGTVPKLQVVAAFVSAHPTDPKSAHPVAHPRVCS
jgi:hypothetical protein